MGVLDTNTIYCDSESNNAREIFASLGMEFVDCAEDADLVWLRKGYKKQYGCMKENQLLNHIPGERAMTHKGHLTRHLKNPQAMPESGISADAFYPESYCIYMEADRRAFLTQLPAEDVKENLWILKPAHLSRGQGMRILWAFDELRRDFETGEGAILNPGDKYVIQRYIRNPLLLKGHKSEIRIYWLIACLDPLLVLVYREGTTRLTTEPYRLEDFENVLIHITNTFQQKEHPDYESFQLKWSFSELEAYVTRELKLAEPGFVEGVLKPRVKEVLSYVVLSAVKTLKRRPRKGLFFGLYGADFILDDTLRPWLAEVQKGPGLSYSDPVKEQVIPPMLGEAARIVLEVQARKRQGELLGDLESVEGFEWVIRG